MQRKPSRNVELHDPILKVWYIMPNVSWTKLTGGYKITKFVKVFFLKISHYNIMAYNLVYMINLKATACYPDTE